MSGGLLCVLPIITHTYAERCVQSIVAPGSACGLKPEEFLVVDNTRDGSAGRYGLETWRHPDGHNVGVARAWNVGVDRMLADEGIDYLVLMSSVMLFGPELHTTWRRQMEEFWGHNVIEASGHSWHLIALHRRLFQRIGRFDPAYYPYAFEQTDWCFRLRMAGLENGFIHVWVNALSQGHALHVNAVSCPADPLLAHYRAKFGGDKGDEKYTMPWGSKPLDYVIEEPIPVLAERYGLGERGVGWW